MIVDWSGAPEDCVGALVACVGNIHFPRVTFVKSVIHEQNRVRGESCDGSALCAYLDVWAYEERPWTGEGLPPVGMVCEIGCADTWTECLIIAHHQHAGVGRAIYTYLLPGAGIEVNWCIAAGFRPIRTPEQIEAEERENAIKGMIADTNILTGIMSDRRIMAGQLYDSGYRKQVQP